MGPTYFGNTFELFVAITATGINSQPPYTASRLLRLTIGFQSALGREPIRRDTRTGSEAQECARNPLR